MPTPLITILQNGKGFNGKQTLIKEFILMPKPNINFTEVRFLSFIYLDFFNLQYFSSKCNTLKILPYLNRPICSEVIKTQNVCP